MAAFEPYYLSQNGSVQNGFFRDEFLQDISTSEAETSMSGKAECLLAIVEDRKSKLLGVTFS